MVVAILFYANFIFFSILIILLGYEDLDIDNCYLMKYLVSY